MKILIRVPNHLGDCIMAMPMVNETREAYPGSNVTVLAPDYLAELYEQNAAVDEIVRIPRAHVHGLVGVFKIKELIAAETYDLGFILPPSFGSASAFKLAGVRERVGYIADGRRLLLTRPLALPTPLNSAHRSELYFDLLRRAKGVDLAYVKPKLFLNDADLEASLQLLDGFGITAQDRYAVVAFRAVAESRRWGTENYTEVCRRLIDQHGLRVILIGSGSDRPEGEEIVAALENGESVINLAGKTSLRETAAVTSRAAIFLGNDSGPAHLAAAVGAPLVVLSGADDPRSTSPISERKKLMYLDHLDCISCVKNKCPLSGDRNMACMKGISPDMVLEAISNWLAA